MIYVNCSYCDKKEASTFCFDCNKYKCSFCCIFGCDITHNKITLEEYLSNFNKHNDYILNTIDEYVNLINDMVVELTKLKKKFIEIYNYHKEIKKTNIILKHLICDINFHFQETEFLFLYNTNYLKDKIKETKKILKKTNSFIEKKTLHEPITVNMLFEINPKYISLNKTSIFNDFHDKNNITQKFLNTNYLIVDNKNIFFVFEHYIFAIKNIINNDLCSLFEKKICEIKYFKFPILNLKANELLNGVCDFIKKNFMSSYVISDELETILYYDDNRIYICPLKPGNFKITFKYLDKSSFISYGEHFINKNSFTYINIKIT